MVERHQIPEAKKLLLEQLFEVIRQLAENEDFWIVKEFDSGMSSHPTDHMSVGWKVAFPQRKGAIKDESGAD